MKIEWNNMIVECEDIDDCLESFDLLRKAINNELNDLNEIAVAAFVDDDPERATSLERQLLYESLETGNRDVRFVRYWRWKRM